MIIISDLEAKGNSDLARKGNSVFVLWTSQIDWVSRARKLYVIFPHLPS